MSPSKAGEFVERIKERIPSKAGEFVERIKERIKADFQKKKGAK